ncbi:type I polyketide synthase [Brevibacillus agri]|uniref:type I polyketide synthase n=1 Tax=Brevibacillus agri TaxID=51101 RepID=UPI002E230826|nr:type I polyketide synthase [Brevibacillus agri]MED1657056.1 type I polyketide synthase [Brevibacillus agri]MED1686760.1 type I polyketide synthase [Brevibacillus agri]MED1693509.1 type I polyketide synthase [Brevibacillus agri]MED1699278.1 type I polyketide synthase [Brevibacillus agri]
MAKKEEMYAYILKQVGSGQLDKNVAARLIHFLRHDQQKEAENDIAIVGIAARLGQADTDARLEQLLHLGIDSIQDIPANRQENAALFLPMLPIERAKAQFDRAGYLPEIDRFDPGFFHISPREASLMDPNQRLFLQLAWEAIEEAGYGGAKLAGSRTGVFIGYSTDFGEVYKKGIQLLAPEAMGIAIPGNIQSIIASRISYLLDLKGPAVAMDTACSSSLVAIHFACRQLIEGACDLALAGGIKLHLFPLKSHAHVKIGIESSDERTKTFDASSDGTGKGEGMGAVLLKPLKKALEDRDHIHAVIKGSAINQDGNSIGITAPNAKAQEEVICQAWEQAGIDPETISYIEAHGTGTKLGDPIEIEGITRAFSRYTGKKQFCAIGSLKTNIGHLDHAAGIAGLVKVIHAMKSKKLFPSLHFQQPNPAIDFSSSAVYVNDQLRDWSASGGLRTAGISSFGLSGTNCHMVVQEAPPAFCERKQAAPLYLLPLSAKDEQVLSRLVAKYAAYVASHRQVDLDDLCYTASTGRGHYSHRLAIVFTDYDDLLGKLDALQKRGLASDERVYYQVHGSGAGGDTIAARAGGWLKVTEEEKHARTLQAKRELQSMTSALPDRELPSYLRLGELYVAGAEIDWERLYEGLACNRISLPVYPFQKVRCWLNQEDFAAYKQQPLPRAQKPPHPLLTSLPESASDHITYRVGLSAADDWVVNEHRVGSEYVLPGTAYIELLLEVGRQQGGLTVIKDLAFLQPFSLREGESHALHITLKKAGDEKHFRIASMDQTDGSWRKHAEGKLCRPTAQQKRVDVSALMKQLPVAARAADLQASGAYITTGARWNNLQELRSEGAECLVAIELAEPYRAEAADYHYHPAMLDNAANIAIRSIGEHLYLPFYYQSIRVHAPIPAAIYSYVRRREQTEGSETATFDIDIVNAAGEVLVEIEGYTIKQVRTQWTAASYYEKDWVVQEAPSPAQAKAKADEAVVVFTGAGELAERLREQLAAVYGEVIEVAFGTETGQVKNRVDYQRLWPQWQAKKVRKIVHLMSVTDKTIQSAKELEEAEQRGFYSLYYLLDSLFAHPHSDELDIILVGDCANRVTGDEAALRPEHGCLLGLGKVAREEFPHVRIRFLDVDAYTDPSVIVAEFSVADAPYQVAYRHNKRYVERLQQATLAATGDTAAIKADGVYVITGGTGGLGLEVGKQISRLHPAKLHLISRQGLPGREKWPEIEAAGADQRRIEQIAAIREMEKQGASVHVHAADISEESELSQVLEHIRAKSGAIRGVIHCAGVAGEGLLVRKPESRIREVLNAKVKGTWLLDQLTEADSLDFFVLFSSMNTVTGGAGQSDYVAANSYLDLYAAHMRQMGKKALTINWPLWRDVGMGQAYEVDNRHSPFESLAPGQGAAIFAELLHADQSQVIVGQLKRRLGKEAISHSLMRDYVLSDSLTNFFQSQLQAPREAKAAAETAKAHLRILDQDEASMSATERAVAKIWAQVLGVQEISVSAKFNSMGGNSVLAVYLFRLLEEAYGPIINISDVFTYSTIAEMAAYIDSKQQPAKEAVSAASTLDLLERLASREISVHEALGVYKTKGGGA